MRRGSRISPSAGFAAEPIAAMNITPLIDVLLVLIVTLIMTIPIMQNQLPADLPQGRPVTADLAVVHRLSLDAAGRLSWDGARIAPAALPARLAAMRADPGARLELSTDGATRYERFDQTLAAIKRAGVTRLGFVGNARFRNFDAEGGAGQE